MTSKDTAGMMTVYWVFLGLFAAAVIFYFVRRIYRLKHGDSTKRAASKVFRLHGGVRGWKLLTGVTLGEGPQAVLADQIAIGPFGIIVACDLCPVGKVYGELEAEEWILANGEEGKEEKTRIPSPYFRAQRCVEQLRGMLAKAKIYSVPVEVLVPKTQRQGSYITGSTPYLLNLKELKAQLEKSHYEKDNGVNVEAIAALLGR